MSRVLPALLIVALCGSATTRADDARVRAIAPFVDDEVVAVLHVDLTKVDLDDLLTRVFQDPDAAREYPRGSAPGWWSFARPGRRIYSWSRGRPTFPAHRRPSCRWAGGRSEGDRQAPVRWTRGEVDPRLADLRDGP